MRRRNLLQWAAGIFGLPGAQWAQTAFPAGEDATLRALAAIVLPVGNERAAERFIEYVRGYRGGAETDHGYGVTYLRRKPASPAAEYVKQLAALERPATRESVKRALDAAGVKEMPRVPDGKNVIADLMSFYFRSSEANDLCYQAAIGRDQCRGLAGSDRAPRPLKERA